MPLYCLRVTNWRPSEIRGQGVVLQPVEVTSSELYHVDMAKNAMLNVIENIGARTTERC